MEQPISILIIDDDEGMLKTLNYILSDKGYDVATFTSGADALQLVAKKNFDIALIDLKMPGMDGVSVFKEIKRLSPNTTIMMITAYTMHKLVEEVKRAGAKVIFSKPLDLDMVIAMADELKDKKRISAAGNDANYGELLHVLEEKEQEIREKKLLIDELKRALAAIKENPAELLKQEKRKRQSKAIHTILKPKQLELFKLLREGEKNYTELFKIVSDKKLNIRDMDALRLQLSRLNAKLQEETTFKILKRRKDKTLYFSIISE